MSDTGKSITNPILCDALALLHRENTPENQNRVLDELVMRAQLLAPVVLSGQTQDTQTDAIQFQLIAAQDGRHFFPAFTDWSQLLRFTGPREQKTVALTFDNFAAMLAENPQVTGFVINPMDHPLTLERDFVAHLSKRKQMSAGYSRQTISKDTKVLFSQAKDCPQALLDSVRLAASGLNEVKALYLRLMAQEGQSQPSYIIVVDFSNNQDKVFRAIADAARPHLGGRFVDMVPFQSQFGQAAAQDTEPFFCREK